MYGENSIYITSKHANVYIKRESKLQTEIDEVVVGNREWQRDETIKNPLRRYTRFPISIDRHFIQDIVAEINYPYRYNDVIMSAMASQIISPTIVYSTVHSGTDERKHQIPVSLAFVHRWQVNSRTKGQ